MDLIASPTGLRGRDLRLLAKIGLAAVLAWWVSELLGADRPAFAAIVPLAALRADDPYGALGVSVFRIAGTVVGIVLGIIALEIDPSAPLWLVAATIAVALAIGLVLRAKTEPINPISAVTALVIIFIGKGRVDTYAWVRIWETFVGAAITMLIAVVVWPPDPISGLRDLLTDLRTDLSADLQDIGMVPGMPIREADMLLDDRIRRSMDTGDVTRTVDRAYSGLRWNPRHRGRREELVTLAVPIRELMGMSRYSRSMLWSLLGDPDGDRIRRWGPEATIAFEEALRLADRAAGEVVDGRDPRTTIEAADGALERFVENVSSGEGVQLASDLRAGARAMLRVLLPTTAARLRALVRERYEPAAGR